MADPKKAVLTITKGKPAVVISSSSVTAGEVEFHYDADDQELDVMVSILKCLEVAREQDF